jgi:uncharacterized alpha-E superfamily protein
MLSRVAERLYWFSRYVERAENTARLMLVRHNLILDLPPRMQPGWHLLIDVLGAEEAFKRLSGRQNEANVIAFVFGSREHAGSLYHSLRSARENMRTTREVMPSEVWERVNSLYLSVARRGKQDLPRSLRHKVLNDIIYRCQQITGMLAGTMTHEDAYHFIRIGRNLERADMSTRIIDVGTARLLGADEDNLPYRGAVWVEVLRSLSAYQMYRKRIRRNVTSAEVLQFLLLSQTFPRAVAHALVQIAGSIEMLPCNDRLLDYISDLNRRLQQTDVGSLQGPALHACIDDLQMHFDQLHGQIQATWFAPERTA